MSRGAIVSLAIFCALLVVVLATREDRVSVGVRSLDLPAFSANEITTIAVSGPSSATLRRDDEGGWTVEDPETPEVRRAADAARVDALAEALASLEIAGFVTGRAESHEELEIDDANGLRVSVEGESGPLADLVFGRRSKTGGDLLRLPESDEVFTTQRALALQARRSVDEWRDRQMIDLDPESVSALVVEREGEPPLRLRRATSEAGESSWSLGPGPELPAGFVFDPAVPARALTTLRSLRADGFLDEGEPGERIVTVVAEGEGGDRLLELAIHAVREDGQVAASIAGDPQRYLLSERRVEPIAPTLEALRDLRILRGGTRDVVRIVVDNAGERTVLESEDGAWTFVDAPSGFDFDASRVEPQLEALARTQAARVLDGAEAEAADFSKPLSIELTGADGETRTVRFGAELAGADGEPREVAVESSDGQRYAIALFERSRYANPLALFARPAAPPPGMGGGPQGLDQLPPDIRRQIEAQLRQQGAR